MDARPSIDGPEQSRQETLDRFKILGFDQPFQESIGFDDYPHASNVKETRNIRELSPGYTPFMVQVDGENA